MGEEFVKKMNAELKDPQAVKDRGGHAPQLGYGPAPADGICLYAQALAQLLNIHPEKTQPPNVKQYTLAEINARGDELYEQFNQIVQRARYNGVGPSPLNFKCPDMPTNKVCDDACRNGKG